MRVHKLNFAVAMAKKGYNLGKLAEKCGISRTTISYVNQGKECNPQMFIKIAEALEVQPHEIVEQKE